MREIKYRAWDKNTKIMIGANNPYVNQFIAGTVASAFTGLHEDNHPYTFMQYTGLKDKNGVEIYEGDIVKWESEDYELYNYKIIFENCSYYAESILGNKSMIGGTLAKDRNIYIEVIGNIYQNKELLQ